MSDAVLLDIDGTLVDSTYHHAVAWHRSFSRLSAPPPPMARIHRAIGMGGDRLVVEVAGQDVEDASGDDLRAAWREEYLPLRAEVQPLPGAAELVAAIAASGTRVALASSGDPQFASEAIDLLGIGEHVELLLTSDDVDASKPDPDLVSAALERLGSVDHALFVGDTVYDVEAARRAGIGCLGLLTGGFASAELEAAGAVGVVDTPADALDEWHRLLIG